MNNNITINNQLVKNIDLSLSEQDITSLISISHNTTLLNNLQQNSLVLSVYDQHIPKLNNDIKYSYQQNNILFINDNREIIPLFYNIINLNSAFTIDKNKYTIKIDNNTIIEKNNVLCGSYTHIPIIKNHIGGRSSYDGLTLTLYKNQLSFIPTSYPFKIKAYLTNLIDNDVIIKNLEIIPSNNSINISSPLIKLLEKNIQQIIQFNCKFIIPFHIFISENFEGEIGKFTVKWSTHDLENYSNELMNVVEYHFKENIHKQKIITKKNDWNFFIEIIDFNLKIIIENLSDEIKNILLKLEVNKENPDYLIEGKVKKKTLVYPSSKHTESFLIIPLRNQLRTIKINHIYIQEFPLDDKLNKNCKIIYNFNPGFININ